MIIIRRVGGEERMSGKFMEESRGRRLKFNWTNAYEIDVNF